ncbi:MAG: ATP-binding protein [Candidatus Hermodarchaeota archaeon]|nr:ATP-binding protein [Candidatus Hermodarchaeota archaeon]
MKELVIVSGKGGTGKTTITAALAALAPNPLIADCDVDAPNLHLLLGPEIQSTEEFIEAKVAVINPELCTGCGACEVACKFDAISPSFQVDPIMCEGCGVCFISCPADAIEMHERLSGYIYASETNYGPMAHALLLAGESNSGKLVTRVRELASNLAKKHGRKLILIDGPPGIACAAISAITGASAGLVVTEPTVPAIHDLQRVLELFQHFNMPVMVLTNKADLNIQKAQEIEEYCHQKGIPVVGELNYDPIMYKAVVAGRPIVEYAPSNMLSKGLKAIWKKVEQQLDAFQEA